jgi:hypothetical protein
MRLGQRSGMTPEPDLGFGCVRHASAVLISSGGGAAFWAAGRKLTIKEALDLARGGGIASVRSQ